MRYWLLPALTALMAFSFIWGAVFHNFLQNECDFGCQPKSTLEVPTLTRVDAQGINLHYSLPLPAMDVELRLATPEEWAETLGHVQVPGSPYMVSGVSFQHPGSKRPCRVVIPMNERTRVFLTPANGLANWADASMGDTIAHELAHCAYGQWHPGWDAIWSANPGR